MKNKKKEKKKQIYSKSNRFSMKNKKEREEKIDLFKIQQVFNVIVDNFQSTH